MKVKTKKTMFMFLFLAVLLLIIGSIFWLGYQYSQATFTVADTYHFGDTMNITGKGVPYCLVILHIGNAYKNYTFNTKCDSNGNFVFNLNIPNDYNPSFFGRYPMWVELFDPFGVLKFSETSKVMVNFLQ